MDGFDDNSWNSIQQNSAQAQAEAERPPNLQFDHSQDTPAESRTDSTDDDQFSIKVVNKGFGNFDHKNPGAKTQNIAPVAESSVLSAKYSQAKSISSEQV